MGFIIVPNSKVCCADSMDKRHIRSLEECITMLVTYAYLLP